MNNPIFARKDIQLCDVPVPAGYPQSQTHSGIFLYDGKYYLTTSPYPGKKYSITEIRLRSIIRRLSFGYLCRSKSGEIYENPCIYIGSSNNGEAPTVFKPMSDRSLMNTPEPVYGLPSFNSDPDIFIENNRVYILNRSVYRTKLLKSGYESITDIFLIEGNVSHERFKMESIKLIKEWEKPYASPCLTKFRNKYIFTYLDTNSALDGKTFEGLFMQELDAISELAGNHSYKEVKVNSGDMLPWHMSLFSYKGVLYTIIACVKKGDKSRKLWQMLGVFNDDLTELTVFQTPITDYNSYRGAACVREDGIFVLYSTVWWEHLKGAKSVDGKDVVMAQCDFMVLLKTIKNN